MDSTRFEFRFATSYRIAAFPFGIRPSTAWAELGPAGLEVRFGPWRLRTPIVNIESAQLTGDFGWLRTAGPAHLSLADRGVTFASNGDAAVCVTFRMPVKAIEPSGRILHPGATLTVADPPALLARIKSLLGPV